MAGHGSNIQSQEEREEEEELVDTAPASLSLPSLPRRLQTNTWRQVFTSLRPLVVNTRQRTLSTYARRLHFRQQQRRNPPSAETDSEEWQPLQGPIVSDGNAESETQDGGRQQSSNVVIDMEGPPRSSSPSRSLTSNNIPVPPLPSHSESTPNSSSSNSSTSALADVGNDSVNAADEAAATNSEDNTENSQQRSTSESISELLNQFPEIRSTLVVVWHYCIFLLIILAKALFDHATGLLVILCLVVAFIWSNSILKKAVACQGRRPIRPLLALLINLPAGLFLLYYSYRNEKLFYSVILIPPEREDLSVWDLLWMVIVSDYVLKICTVLFKTFITLLPQTLMHYQNRGKYFLVMEQTSQLYRSLAPIQPWLSYLLDNYHGPRKVLGVFLSATYMVCKGPDIVTRMKNFQAAIMKFMKSVNYGCTPSKDQLEDAGGLCPICHDEFSLPTMLTCKHIFCEQCVVTWFDRERTCPMCRTEVADDPAWRDGGTSHFMQLY